MLLFYIKLNFNPNSYNSTSILHIAEFQKINVLGIYLGFSNELNMASWGNLM